MILCRVCVELELSVGLTRFTGGPQFTRSKLILRILISVWQKCDKFLRHGFPVPIQYAETTGTGSKVKVKFRFNQRQLYQELT